MWLSYSYRCFSKRKESVSLRMYCVCMLITDTKSDIKQYIACKTNIKNRLRISFSSYFKLQLQIRTKYANYQQDQ